MAAYFVAQYVVNDPDAYRNYQKGAGPTIMASGAKVVSLDPASQVMEGTPPGPQTVILEFESKEAAEAWYNSEEYQAVIGERLAATEGHAVIVESFG